MTDRDEVKDTQRDIEWAVEQLQKPALERLRERLEEEPYKSWVAEMVADAREEGTVAGYQAASAECQEAVAQARAEERAATTRLREALVHIVRMGESRYPNDSYSRGHLIAVAKSALAADRLAERSHDSALQEEGERDRRRSQPPEVTAGDGRPGDGREDEQDQRDDK